MISVIISTYNRAESLGPALKSFWKQEGIGNFEVLVVDNNSTDQTKEVVEAAKAESGGKLKYAFQPVQGKSHALNMAVGLAKGDILVFTDDDVIADSRWLANMTSAFEKYSCDGVGGRVLPQYPGNTPQWIKDNPRKIAGVVVISDFGEETKPFEESMERLIGANYAFKKKILVDNGGFRTDLGPGQGTTGEDTELVWRLLKKGKKIFYCGQALVWHPVDLERLKWKPLANWHIQQGRFSARQEYEDSSKHFVYLNGVPRYLFAGVVRDIFGLVTHPFDRLGFLDSYRALFRKIGMIKEYRAIQMRKKT